MKYWLAVLLTLALVGLPVTGPASREGARENSSQADPSRAGFLYDFLEGAYLVIGTRPGSRSAYSGTAVVKRAGNRLEVIRRIAGKEIVGIGTVESATADKRLVLRVRFTDKGRAREATYIVCSDLDNYPRLTGYVYSRDGSTKIPGLEAWFSDAGR